MDMFSVEKRSAIMRNIHSKNTKPELIVRKLLCQLKFGNYRLKTRQLSFYPDVVYPGHKKAIFVHGCFWHGHECQGGRIPKSNTEYWEFKIQSNIDRDNRNVEELTKKGWSYLTIWECELKQKNRATLINKIQLFMND